MHIEYNIPPEINVPRHIKDHRAAVHGKVLVHYPCDHEFDGLGFAKHLLWLCECDCGVMFTARSNSLNIGSLSSCGRCEYVNPQLFKNQHELPRKKDTRQLELPLEQAIPEDDASFDAALAAALDEQMDHLPAEEEVKELPEGYFDGDGANEAAEMPDAYSQGYSDAAEEIADEMEAQADIISEVDVIRICDTALSEVDAKQAERVLAYLAAKHCPDNAIGWEE